MNKPAITSLSRTDLTAAGVVRSMTPSEARAKANAELIVVIVPGDGGYYYATPQGFGVCGTAQGSFECFEAECVAAGWIVEVAS